MSGFKVTKSQITKFVNEKGLELFDFNKLIEGVNHKDIIELITNKTDFFQYYPGAEGVVKNVKTYISCDVTDFPQSITDKISQQDVDNYINYLYESNVFQEEFEHWSSIELQANFFTEGKSGGYWGIKDFTPEELFTPATDKEILNGLASYIDDNFIELRNHVDDYEDFCEICESILEDLQQHYESQEGFLPKILEDYNLVSVNQNYIDKLHLLSNLADEKVFKYEKDTTIIYGIVDIMRSNGDIDTEEYCKLKDDLREFDWKRCLYRHNLKEEKKEFNVSYFDKNKKEQTLSISYDTTITTDKFYPTIDGINNHEKIFISGKEIEINHSNTEDIIRAIKKLEDYKQLQDISSNKKQVSEIQTPIKILEIKGVENPSKISYSIDIEQDFKLNKKINEYQISTKLFAIDNTEKDINGIKPRFELKTKEDLEKLIKAQPILKEYESALSNIGFKEEQIKEQKQDREKTFNNNLYNVVETLFKFKGEASIYNPSQIKFIKDYKAKEIMYSCEKLGRIEWIKPEKSEYKVNNLEKQTEIKNTVVDKRKGFNDLDI